MQTGKIVQVLLYNVVHDAVGIQLASDGAVQSVTKRVTCSFTAVLVQNGSVILRLVNAGGNFHVEDVQTRNIICDFSVLGGGQICSCRFSFF